MDKSARKWEEFRAEARARAAEMREAQIRRRDGTEAGAGVVGGAFNVLSQSVRQAAAELDKLKVPATIDPAIEDARKRANELALGMDPVGDLRRQVYGIRHAFQMGLITDPNVRDAAMADAFRRATGKADWQFRLPSAAEYGTSEFARAQALAAGGRQQESAAAHLQALVDFTRQERDEVKRLADEIRDLYPLLATPARMER